MYIQLTDHDQQFCITSQPIRKALKTPKFVLSEAMYCRTKKKLRGAGQVQKVLRGPLTKKFRSRQHLLC